jgi:hypothetical protein
MKFYQNLTPKVKLFGAILLIFIFGIFIIYEIYSYAEQAPTCHSCGIAKAINKKAQ